MSAVEGGRITDIESANAEIRQIVEARNATRNEELARNAAAHAAGGCCLGTETGTLSEEDIDDLEQEIDDSIDMDLPMVEFAENPKDIVGSGKLPLHLWPTTATAMGCIAMLNGMLKYGRTNWRESGVRASIYVDACKRHLDAWFEGHECDEEGVPHLSSALACIAIIIDADAAGKLRDDRNYPGGYREMMERLTPIVSKLRKRHADKSPHDWTIADATRRQ
jgi:hypothetical protein